MDSCEAGQAEPPAHEFGATTLEPFQGPGVVERSHLVRFAIPDAQREHILHLAHR